MSELPPLWAKVFLILGPFFVSIGLIFARDNNVTSEDVGATTGRPATPPTEPKPNA